MASKIENNGTVVGNETPDVEKDGDELSFTRTRIYIELLYHGHMELLIRLRENDISCLEEVRSAYTKIMTPVNALDEEMDSVIELVDMDIVTLKQEMGLIPTSLEHAASILERLKPHFDQSDIPYVDELIRMAKGEYDNIFDGYQALGEIYINNKDYAPVLCEIGNYVTESYSLYEACSLDESEPKTAQDGMFKALQSASFN